MNEPLPYFPPLRIGAVVHDLGHLDPVRFQVSSEKLRRAITVRCRFSNHVFSRTFDPVSDPADAPLVMDGVRRRIFCPDRYRQSFQLPAAISGLRDPRTYVRETKAKRNWLYIATVELPSIAATQDNGLLSAAVRYQVFFTLRKAAKRRGKPGGCRDDGGKRLCGGPGSAAAVTRARAVCRAGNRGRRGEAGAYAAGQKAIGRPKAP